MQTVNTSARNTRRGFFYIALYVNILLAAICPVAWVNEKFETPLMTVIGLTCFAIPVAVFSLLMSIICIFREKFFAAMPHLAALNIVILLVLSYISILRLLPMGVFIR